MRVPVKAVRTDRSREGERWLGCRRLYLRH